jgi:hypothetical protein
VNALARLVLILLTAVVLLLIVATGLLAWQGEFSEAGRERLWVVIGVYMAGCFTVLGILVGKKDE